jgi:hypothetical protein
LGVGCSPHLTPKDHSRSFSDNATTGHVSSNIIHYSEDELYTSDGTFYGGNEEAAPATTLIFS